MSIKLVRDRMSGRFVVPFDSRMFLAKKPSEWILYSLECLQKCEDAPEYEIMMGAWYTGGEPEIDKTCHVCLAGSVMAAMLPRVHYHSLDPDDFRPAVLGDIFRGVDYFRLNQPEKALEQLGYALPEQQQWPTVLSYGDDRSAFMQGLTRVSAVLNGLGM